MPGKPLHDMTGENISEWEVALTGSQKICNGFTCLKEKARFVFCACFFLPYLCLCRCSDNLNPPRPHAEIKKSVPVQLVCS